MNITQSFLRYNQTMARLEIAALDDDTLARLNTEAERRNLKPEALAAELLRESLKARRGPKRRDVSHLAGTWTQKEAKEFNRLIEEMFEQVDEDAWKERGEPSSL